MEIAEMPKKKKEMEEETNEPAAAEDSQTILSGELSEPLWAVISFERCEANGLTYEEAARKIAELEAAKVSGLCIITDRAAALMTGE